MADSSLSIHILSLHGYSPTIYSHILYFFSDQKVTSSVFQTLILFVFVSFFFPFVYYCVKMIKYSAQPATLFVFSRNFFVSILFDKRLSLFFIFAIMCKTYALNTSCTRKKYLIYSLSQLKTQKRGKAINKNNKNHKFITNC